jgi:hypothetical protein
VLVRRSILIALALLCASASAASARQRLDAPIWGVTLDNDGGIGAKKLAAQVDALKALPVRATARIVLDYGSSVSDYSTAIPAIHGAAGVMAQLADSSEVKGVSTAAYARWVQKLVDAYKGQVDVWEIGNEINGEWVGTPAQELARIQAASQIVRAAGGKTALTLYYNPDCWSKRANELFTWLGANQLPAADEVLVSYYPGDCNDYWPSTATWQSVFDRLHARFPAAQLGFGEAGASSDALTPAANAALLQQYTSVAVAGDDYVGGYFWWYWAEDAVPRTNAFWAAYAALEH